MKIGDIIWVKGEKKNYKYKAIVLAVHQHSVSIKSIGNGQEYNCELKNVLDNREDKLKRILNEKR